MEPPVKKVKIAQKAVFISQIVESFLCGHKNSIFTFVERIWDLRIRIIDQVFQKQITRR